jgi:uncharacterized protein YjcR
MSEETTLLQQIMVKLDKLNDKVSAMESSITGTLQKHSTEIAQLQKEKEQLFGFYNGDIAKMKEEISKNRHNLANLQAAKVTMHDELHRTMDELSDNTRQDFALRLAEELKIKNQNRMQNFILLIVAIVSAYLTWKQG